MRLNFQFLLLLCILAVTVYAQNDQSASLNIGDSAPPLQLREWLKGTPVQEFEKGKVYVVEFWATWCKPCKAAMPHLSALANEYKDKVIVLGINAYETKSTSLKTIKSFIDSMGARMDYNVAAEDSNFMVAGWLDASGDRDMGIPRSFVVNGEGKVAWIGQPKDLGEVLPKIVNNNWDIKEALAKRNLDKYLKELDREVNLQLNMYVGNPEKPSDPGKPEWALLVINEFVNNEPKLKYAPVIAFHTFSSLLKTDPCKAYEYGKVAIVTTTYEEAAYDMIIAVIKIYSDKLILPAEIYQLGIEAYQAKIDQIVYPEIENTYRFYKQMAAWYWHIQDKSNAIKAQQKAIEILKSNKSFSAGEMVALESNLQQYINR